MKPVKWGIISTANIGVAKVIPGMLKSKALEVAAISSRDLATAKKAARKLGIAKAYGSYEEMLADPEIEAVYNPLPNHLHVPLTLAAAKAGKHVLCEKPMAMDAKEAALLRKAPKGVIIAEAFMVRHAAAVDGGEEARREGRDRRACGPSMSSSPISTTTRRTSATWPISAAAA